MNVATLGAASSQLAVVTPVPPDTPEKAVLKQQNAILTDHVSWMAEHAEDYVYREKQRQLKLWKEPWKSIEVSMMTQ